MYKRGELLHKSLNGGMSVETPKFKIESTIVALHIIEQNDYMFSLTAQEWSKERRQERERNSTFRELHEIKEDLKANTHRL